MAEPNRAETLFCDWLSRVQRGEPVEIETLAAANPECADELRQLHDEWVRMKRILDLGGGNADDADRASSLSDRLRERFGPHADPGVDLDGAEKSNDAKTEKTRSVSNDESRLYDDLRARGPSSGRYRLEGEIAQGGMGIVMRVFDKDLRRNLAMKVMLEEKEGRLSRFLEEAQVTGQLDHPGIVPVHELGIDQRGKVFFTMKLVKGRTLAEVFDMTQTGEDGWNVTRALDVLKRVCEAMAFAHEKKVIHRDLKPANVMVGRHGEVYVMDWGLARVLGRKDLKDVRVRPASQSVVNTERREFAAETPNSPLLTMDGDAIGTPSYMSIEQAEGDLDAIGPHSDVYAVGAMLYHLLAGHPPYVEAGTSPSGRVILDRVKRAPPDEIRSLAKGSPAELIAICEKALGRKPAQRYASMSDLADDLRAYLERRVVKAYRTGVVAETRMWVARNRALAATIVVAFGFLGAFAWQQRERAAESDRVFRLSDVKELRDLQARGKALLDDRAAVYRSYSDYTGLIETRRQWVIDAEALARRLPTHQATLARIESRGMLGADGTSLEFGSKEDTWWYSAVAELVSGLCSLTEDANAISTRAMEDRIAEFVTIFEHSIGEHRAEWNAAIASITDPAHCPQYNGLKIAPQVGLLPIGRDPQSGLWEFWFVNATGVAPKRDADGKLVLTDDFGLVFVLLPGRAFNMGAQEDNPEGQNYDPDAKSTTVLFLNVSSKNLFYNNWAEPVHSVTLKPFFISKYEMTEHQYTLASGENAWHSREKSSRDPASISWDEANDVLPRLGLALPTEAQWEYACRAGTATQWSTGTEKESLLGHAAITDEGFSDYRSSPAPVGSLSPNGFGLHDMHGNFSEWCRDGFDGSGDYKQPKDPETGERASDNPCYRVFRGGEHLGDACQARSAARSGGPPGFIGSIGLRPTRELTVTGQ